MALRIGIVGAGAIGTRLGLPLISQCSLSLLPRPCSKTLPFQQWELWTDESKKIHGIKPPFLSMTDEGAEWDIVLLCVKATALGTLLPHLQKSKHVHDKTIIIPLQNGWGSIDLIQQYFNKERILPAVTYMGANVISKGIVQKGGDGITYLCGSQQPEIQKQVQRLQQAWSIVGIPSFIVEPGDIETKLWTKVMINAAINPIACILNGPNGVTLSDAGSAANMQLLLQESLAVGTAMGIQGLEDPWPLVQKVVHDTQSNICSSLADLRRGQCTEMEFIQGAVLSQSILHNINVPMTTFLYHMCHTTESQKLRFKI